MRARGHLGAGATIDVEASGRGETTEQTLRQRALARTAETIEDDPDRRKAMGESCPESAAKWTEDGGVSAPRAAFAETGA
jgi:hypothetical protein